MAQLRFAEVRMSLQAEHPSDEGRRRYHPKRAPVRAKALPGNRAPTPEHPLPAQSCNPCRRRLFRPLAIDCSRIGKQRTGEVADDSAVIEQHRTASNQGSIGQQLERSPICRDEPHLRHIMSVETESTIYSAN